MIDILMFKILMIVAAAIIGATAGTIIGKLGCYLIDKIEERIKR